MRNLLLILSVVLLSSTVWAANPPQDLFEVEGNQVKKTSYYENGEIKQVGFFLNNELDGQWVSYDKNGDIKTIAFYKNGKKDGVWIFVKAGEITNVVYKDNKIIEVKKLK